jgi:phosphorylase kinase alpha/beta subunit
MSLTPSQLYIRLDSYYQKIQSVIMARQNPITGLLPASTAVNAHGDYTDAWVRDNVYSILAVWGLALAYRKVDDRQGRTFELEHSVVKLMRGLLFCMMRQAEKVETFKQTQSLLDCLHAKYNTHTGDVVVGDEEWGHLQVDATSLFLLMLAQMTASGLQIIYTLDEVNFIQNLVYYIGRAYRTPDYGIWERGNKINKGNAELNASSIGMAKAALEAMNGLDLFGVRGSQASVIHVLPDEIARAKMTLESLLPRESLSKEIDAALLSIISFPAFAVERSDLVESTRNEIISKLAGKYGCKRFLRDGHQTVLEDTKRLHYEPWELRQFEHIECEWPLFFTYLVLDGLFHQNRQQVETYQNLLEPLFVEREGIRLLPELYYVPADKIEAEKECPQTQSRLPNENIPLVWAQSLYFLSELFNEGLIAAGDIDPLGRHLLVGKHRHPTVQIALLAEDEDLQDKLSAYGIATQTPEQVEPIQIRQATELSAVYAQIGRNDKLNLTGRPVRRLRSLTTSRLFNIRGKTLIFLPSFLDLQQFYLTLDYHFLVDQIKSELAYIHHHWHQLGRPLIALLITESMLDSGTEALLNLMQELKAGECAGVPIKLGRINELMLTAGCERIDFLHDFEFTTESVKDAAPRCSYLSYNPDKTWPLSHTQEFALEYESDLKLLLKSLRDSQNLYEQIELLHTLVRLKGLNFDTGFGGPNQPITVADLLNEVYFKASQSGQAHTKNPALYWAVIRHAAGLLNKVDIGLSDAVTDILVRQKQIAVGKSYTESSLITRPMSYPEIMDKISQFCREDIRDRVLSQEILIYLGLLIKSEPQLFEGLLTLRVGYFILLLTSELAHELGVTQDEAYEKLMQLSPFEIKTRLRQVLAGYEGMNQLLQQQESLHIKQPEQEIDWVVVPVESEEQITTNSWHRQRQMNGSRGWVPKDFFNKVWMLMKHCKGIVIGDKLERRNRLESELMLSEMTSNEHNFALKIEHLLNKIEAPEYRQVNIEALMELAAIAERNPNLQVEEYIVLDVLIGHAVRQAWLESFPEKANRYDEDKAAAWRSFYESSPSDCSRYVVKAFRFLTHMNSASAA